VTEGFSKIFPEITPLFSKISNPWSASWFWFS